jgi:serine/threonine protein kinase/Tol biopolymer transport system component
MSDDKRADRARSDPERLSTLLSAVLELPPADRERWIDESSTGNVRLREQLREMLRQVQGDSGQLPSSSETAYLAPPGSHPSGGTRGRDSTTGESSRDQLTLGQHVGRYQVLDLLGAGGMGRVYRALDATLGREVAIKGLADAFRGDSTSLRRFEREARVLATLSHPNIAAIYGFEQLNGSPYLVLERIEGETLAQRLVRGPVPVDEALAIAVQIIAGLEEAHAKGVIHRDLKPSNVMLTPAGNVKLVDFGLAKTSTLQPDPAESIDPITQIGLVVGTARYMSPEQVTGREVDTRTDVWAFGCVLYEMLSAKPVFGGRSVSEVAAAVLRDEPDWSVLPAAVPRAVQRLIRRCLRRDPRSRLQHIGDARIELVDLEQESSDRSAAGIAPPSPGRRFVWPIVAGLAIAGLVAGFFLRPKERAAPPPVRLSLELPAPLALVNAYPSPFAVSPNGALLALEVEEAGTRQLYLRDLGQPAVRRLTGTDGALQPFFSPDGQWVGFFTARRLVKVSINGGSVLDIADVGGNSRGATWTSDGSIVWAAQTTGLQRVSDRGGRPVALTTLDKARDEYSHRWPDAVPGTPWVIFTVGLEDATFDEGRIDAVNLQTGERRQLIAGAGFARYWPGTGLLFVRGGRVYKVGLDVRQLAVVGTPEVLLDAVRYDWRNGGTHLAVSPGVLIYTPGQPTSHQYFLSRVGHDGQFTRAVDTPRRFRDLSRSADGARIAAVVGTAMESDLWAVDANATLSQLSFGLSPYRPTWTADGRGITVGAKKDGKWRLVTIPADGTGDPSVLLEGANRMYPDAWSPDGRHLLFQEAGATSGWDLRTLEVDASGRAVGPPKAFAASPFHESTAAISPDGKWVAYESDELDGIVQIYVRAWPDGTHKVRASPDGARLPAWGSNGDLYYWETGENMLRVIRTREQGGQLIVGPPEPVWKGSVGADVLRRVVITTPNGRYDIDPGGARFWVLEKAAADAGPELKSPVVVLGLDGGH